VALSVEVNLVWISILMSKQCSTDCHLSKLGLTFAQNTVNVRNRFCLWPELKGKTCMILEYILAV